MKTIVTTLALLFSLGLAHAQKTYTADWASIDSRPVPEWFVDAKFGIFIHWGLYAVPAWGPTDGAVYDKYAEWYWWKLLDKNNPVNGQFVNFHNTTFGPDFKYQDFVAGFKCEMFEPTDWAKLFRDAGARYVVLTSKHHEGFALWPSTHAWNWNAVDVGPHRDLAGDLIQAVRAEGLRMGYYYSLYEWFNPLYRSDVGKYVDQHMIPQMKDLVTRYKPDIVWTDGEWDHPSEVWKSTEFLAWLYNESPVRDDVVVNDRWGKETRSVHGGIYTTEYDLVHEGVMTGVMEHPWEECRGIGGSFGYNRNENLSDYSTSGQLVHILIDKVARGGNLLLNIGPTADGRIPVIMQQRLKDMGDWLTVNGEAIYGTRRWENAPAPGKDDLYFTRKGNDLYVFSTVYPSRTISVQGIRGGTVSLLGYPGKVRASAKGNTLSIAPPALTPATSPCDHAWVFKVAGAFR